MCRKGQAAGGCQTASQPMKIRTADMEDSQDIWRWRNDPHTRDMSTTPEEISWKDHSAWYANTLASESSLILVGVDDASSDTVGMVRFDIEPDGLSAEVSINLNPRWRGKKISKTLLKLAVKRFRSVYEMPVTAMIKRMNPASIKCFEECGFKRNDEDETFFRYRL